MPTLFSWARLALILVPIGCLAATPSDILPPPAEASEHQSFRRWTRQREVAAAALFFAPGANIAVAQSSQSVRMPFVLVTLDDSPDEVKALIPQLQSRLFTVDGAAEGSLQGYFDRLFEGKLRFFDQSDIIHVSLPGMVSDYFQDAIPKRRFLEKVAKAIETKNVSLEVYDNDHLENDAFNPDRPDDQEIDLMVIFVLAPSMSDSGRRQAWPLRWWTEWMTPTGVSLSGNEGPVIVSDVSGRQLKISSFCVAPVTERGGDQIVLGTGFLAHEILHGFGLPDLYDRDNGSAGCGSWCCMAWGMYGGVRKIAQLPWDASPVWPSAWCRAYLTVDGNGIRVRSHAEVQEEEVTLVSPLGEGGNRFLRIDLPGRKHPLAGGLPAVCERYLLIEYRGPELQGLGVADWDSSLPNAGFLVWEVDEGVGRADVSANRTNAFWPMTFRQGFGQNDEDESPLVALWRKGALTRRNIAQAEPMEPTYLWRDGTFEHPDGVIISDFKFLGKKAVLHYRVNPAAANAPAAPASVGAPRPVESFVPAAPATQKLTGLASEIKPQLSDSAKGQLSKVFTAYPKFEHSVAVGKSGVASFILPAASASKNAFVNDVREQLQLIGGAALGDSSARLPLASPTLPAQLGGVFAANEDLSIPATIRVGDQILRVTGAGVQVGRVKGRRDRLRYDVKRHVDVPKLPSSLQGIASKVEIERFVRDRLGPILPESATWELVVENGSGDLKWQSRIPAGPAEAPITIEVDAQIGNLSDEVAILVR